MATNLIANTNSVIIELDGGNNRFERQKGHLMPDYSGFDFRILDSHGILLSPFKKFDEYTIEGVTINDFEDFKTWVSANFFRDASSGGGGTWGSITGDITDQTDLVDYIDEAISGGSKVLILDVDAGMTSISLDIANPPISSAFVISKGGLSQPLPHNTLTALTFPSSGTNISIKPGSGALKDITRIASSTSTGGGVTWDLSKLEQCSNLAYFEVGGAGHKVNGDLSSFATINKFTRFYTGSGGSNNNITGNLSFLGLLTSCTSIRFFSTGIITGNINFLNNVASNFSILYLVLYNASSDITGNLNIFFSKSNLTLFSVIAPATTSFTYTSITHSRTTANTVQINAGLTTAIVDAILIDLALITTWTGGRVVHLAGNNQARSSASDTAVTTLTSAGVTVTTN